MLKKTILILLPILLLFCFAGSATADGADGEVESYDYGSDTASADSGAVSLEGSETSSADTAVSSEPVVTEEALPAETEVLAENTGTFDSGSPADEQGNESENMPASTSSEPEPGGDDYDAPEVVSSSGSDSPAADSDPLEGGASDPEGPAEQADAPLEEDLQQNSCDEGEESPLLIDPYFYDAGGTKHPYFGADGIQQAINEFETKNGRGFIYVESGTFNGFYANGVPNLTGIVFKDFYPGEADAPFNPHDPSTWPLIDGTVSIADFKTSFTLLGFRIAGNIWSDDGFGQLNLSYLAVEGANYGISVLGHTGNVVISNIESKGASDGYGAYIHNTNGGNVTVTNSAFNDNSIYGIKIDTNGIVTANGISASGNAGGRGMEVNGFSRLTINSADFSSNSQQGLSAVSAKNANIAISNAYVFGNGGTGMALKTEGVVTVIDAALTNNSWRGISIENHTAAAARNVTLTRCSADSNSLEGIYIRSKGAVTLTDVGASGNGHRGVYISNTQGTANVTVRSSRAANYYDFSGNVGTGIMIISNGTVSVSNVNAVDNGGHGILLDNRSVGTARNVVLTRCRADSNSWVGIHIQSKGAVTLIDTSASHNGTATWHDGVYIGNYHGTGNVMIRSSKATDLYHFSLNAGSGIYIDSNGAISVSNVIADGNGENGIAIFNHGAPAARNVTLTRCRADSNSWVGIHIQSKGAVTLIDTSASHNGSTTSHRGVYISNTQGTANVTIRSSKATDYYHFSGNTGSGIHISSKGVVSVSNVTADGNGANGINLQNHNAPAARNVTLTRVTVTGNTEAPWSQHGIFILSRGNVLLTDVSSSENRNNTGYHCGLYVDNRGFETSPGVWNGTGSVTIRSSRAGTSYDFSGNNYGHGIAIISRGVVSISDVNASGNGTVDNRYGIMIVNYDAPSAARAVILTRCSADSNAATGIRINSKGAVTLTDVSATGNGHRGVDISNTQGTANVTVRSSRAANYYDFSGNAGRGIHILSNGAISVSNVNAVDNGGNGILLDNRSVGTARNVVLTRCSADSNSLSGILIFATGAVTLTDVGASGNGHRGVDISNTQGTANVTVRSSRAANYYDFSGNVGTGIMIISNGTVSVSNVNAVDNGGHGIYLDNRTVDTGRNVTLTRCSADSNSLDGLYIQSKGAVTLIDTSASHNGTATWHDGVYIGNYQGTANVTIRSSRAADYYDFSGNVGTGIMIISNGTVSVSNVNTVGNGNHGVNCTTYAANKNITLRNINSFSNSATGLYTNLVEGTVTVQNVRSYRNGTKGIYVHTGIGRVNFVNSSFIGNGTDGIDVRRLPAMVSLRTTYAAGNGSRNINITP